VIEKGNRIGVMKKKGPWEGEENFEGYCSSSGRGGGGEKGRAHSLEGGGVTALY